MVIAVTSAAGKVTITRSSSNDDLAPDEARRLAVSLIEHAARAENPPEASTWP